MGTGWLLNLLTRYFSLTPVPESFQSVVSAPARPIIVTNSDSIIVQALLNSFALRIGITSVERWTGQEPTPAALYWINVHDSATLDFLATKEAPLLSTCNIVYGRGPTTSFPAYRLGLARSLALLFLSRFLVIIFGDPITPPTTARRPMTLARFLKLDFYKNLKVVRGTPFQSIDAQARAVLGGAEFEREISIVAQRSKEDPAATRRKARKEFFEMAAHPRAIIFWLIAPMADFIVRRLFSRVLLSGLESFEAAVREHTVVVVPMHRSHLDYIILGSTLYQSRINPPVVAAGVNLRFWPAGFFIRSLGGYFVKRNARNDRIHALVLRRYVTYLVKRGHSQEFFIEGGRSRSGKMRPPKVGILSIIVEAYLKGLRRDILLIPVSISYENVIEDSAFGFENTGQAKTKENFRSLLQARSIFRKQYGDVSVHFGTAVSLQQFLKSHPTRSENEAKGKVLALGNALTRAIRDQSTISLSSLAYTALLMAPRYALPRTELVRHIRELAGASAVISKIDGLEPRFSPALSDFMVGAHELLHDLPRGGTISRGSCLGEDVFIVRGTKRFTADFYKNATIHVFFEMSILSILELLGRPLNADEACVFHSYFEQEHLLAPLPEFRARMTAVIEGMQKAAFLTAGSNPKFASRESGAFCPGLLVGSIQALLWTVQNVRRIPVQPGPVVEAGTEDYSFSYDALLNSLVQDFKSAGYLGLVTRTEASSQAALISALEFLQQRRFIGVQETGQGREIVVLKDLRNEESFLREVNDAVTRWQYRY